MPLLMKYSNNPANNAGSIVAVSTTSHLRSRRRRRSVRMLPSCRCAFVCQLYNRLLGYSGNRLCTSFRFDQHVVGHGFGFDCEAEERAEGGVAGCSSVEAKDKLVEVGLQMFAAQPVVDDSCPGGGWPRRFRPDPTVDCARGRPSPCAACERAARRCGTSRCRAVSGVAGRRCRWNGSPSSRQPRTRQSAPACWRA